MKRDLKNTIANISVLVVGDAMIDQYWYGDVDRVSPEAPVPVVRINNEEYRLGGAANVALNIRKLGAKASLMSVVGNDSGAAILHELLQQNDISPLLKSDPDLKTILKLRIIGRQQQLLRVDFENRPNKEILASLTEDFNLSAKAHNAVLLSDYGKGGLAHAPLMIELVQSLGLPVLVDPKGDDYTAYRGATLITPNRMEMAQVVGAWNSEEELEQKAMKLKDALDLQSILVTRSEAGMSLFDDEGHLHVHGEAREVFDVTGAGDTVIAVMATLMAAGLSAREALPLANRAGGRVVGKFGTASVSYEELF